MKRKLVFGLTVILAVGLAVLSCSNGTNPGTDPNPGGGFVVPSNWVSFSETEMLDAKFYDQLGNDGSVIKNADGTYTVTLKVRSDDYPDGATRSSVVWFTFTEPDMAFRKGYYVNLTLPKNAVYKPVSVDILPSSNDSGTNGTWTASQNSTVTGDLPAEFDSQGYVVGDISFHWGTEEEVDYVFKTLAIWFTWDDDAEAGEEYTFKINSIKVPPYDTSTPDPDPEPWTPAPIAAPDGWIDYPADLAAATFYPGWGSPKIEAKAGGGYTVTLKVRDQANDPGHSFIRIPVTENTVKGGYYMSLTLPDQTLTSTMKPKRVYTYAVNGGTSNWNSVVDYQPANKWIQGKVDCLYEHDSFVANAIEIQIYWRNDAVGEQDYVFTIDKFLVKEKSTEGPSAEKPAINPLSKFEDKTYTIGATADPIIIVPEYTANWGSYDYNWYWKKGPITEPPDPATFDYYKWGGDGNALDLGGDYADVQGKYIVPSTAEAGTFYYYVTMTFGSEVTMSPIAKIVVNN